MEKLEWKEFFVGAFANLYFSMLGLGDVKNAVVETTIYVSCRPKTPLVFLRKTNRVCTNWEFAFWQTSINFSQWNLQNGITRSAAVKAMRIG